MQTVTTIGFDIAKSVFQVHGVDAAGEVVIRRQLKRRYVLAFFQKLPPCLVGMEACASSHYWSRELQALGHTVRLMPPAYIVCRSMYGVVFGASSAAGDGNSQQERD
jgi:transposase